MLMSLKLRFLNKLAKGIVTTGLSRSGGGVRKCIFFEFNDFTIKRDSLRLRLVNRLYPAKTRTQRSNERMIGASKPRDAPRTNILC